MKLKVPIQFVFNCALLQFKKNNKETFIQSQMVQDTLKQYLTLNVNTRVGIHKTSYTNL